METREIWGTSSSPPWHGEAWECMGGLEDKPGQNPEGRGRAQRKEGPGEFLLYLKGVSQSARDSPGARMETLGDPS